MAMKSNYIVRGGYDASSITKGLAQTQKQLMGFQKQTGKTMSAIGGGMKLALGYISVRAIAGFVKATTKLASDLTEVQNVVDVTFGSMASEVDEFAKTSITSFGLSELAAKKYTSTMGAMLKSSGLGGAAAKDMSIDLVKLSADMASFYNLSNDEAFEKIQSGMAGMSRPLRDLGINMNIVNLNAYALSQGIKQTYKQMSQQNQQILRYNYLMSVTGDAQGDFARTSMTWANQIKILGQQFKMLGGTIGGGFINMITPLLSVINSIIAKLQVAAEYFKAFTALIFGDGNQDAGGAAVSNIADATEDATDGMGDLGNAGSKAAKKIKGAFASIDEITTLGSKDNGASGSGGSSGTGGVGGVAPVDLGTLTKGEFKIDENITKMFDDIRKAAEPTLTAIKNLWDNGLSKFATFTWTALKDFYKEFLLPIGKWVLGKNGLPKLLNAFNDLLVAINWDKLNKALKNFWKAIEPFAQAVGQGFVDFVVDITKALTPAIVTLTNGFAEALEKIAEALDETDATGFESLGKLLGAFTLSMVTVKILEGLAKALKGITTPLKTLSGISLDPTSLSIFFGDIANTFDEGLRKLSENTFGPFWTDMLSMITEAGYGALIGFTVGNLPGAIIGAIAGALGGAITLDSFKGFWKKAYKTLFNFDSTKESFKSAINNFKEAFSGDKSLAEIGEYIVAGIVDGFESAFSFILEPIVDFFKFMYDGICKEFGIHSPSTEMKPIGKNILLGIRDGISDTFKEFTDFIKGLPVKIITGFGDIKTGFTQKGKDIIEGIKKGWSDTGADFKAWLSKKPATIATDFGTLKTGFITKGKEIITGIKQGWNDSWSDFKAWLSGLPKKIASGIGSLNEVGKNLVKGFVTGLKSIKIPKLDVSLGTTKKTILGKDIDVPKVNVGWVNGYATGGFPSAGELFMGNENGIEMMGRMGNQNVVANNNQITDGIKQAVIEAMMISNGNQRDNGTTQLNLIVDSEVLATAVDKGKASLDRRGSPTMSFA